MVGASALLSSFEASSAVTRLMAAALLLVRGCNVVRNLHLEAPLSAALANGGDTLSITTDCYSVAAADAALAATQLIHITYITYITYIYIYTHIHIYIYTYIYTHTYIYTINYILLQYIILYYIIFYILHTYIYTYIFY